MKDPMQRLVADINKSLQSLADQVNEANRAQATGHATLLFALLEKGVLTPNEIDAAKKHVAPLVDEHFGPRPEEKKLDVLRELFNKAGVDG